MAELPDPDLKYDLPKELLTDERLEAAAIEQRQLAERINSPYAHKSPQDIQRFNASILVKEAAQTGKLHPVAREQYAEALAELGHFDAAAKATRDKDKRKYYREISQAVNKPDGERCKCPRAKFGDVKKNNLFAEAEVWSQKHGKLMPVVRCNTCGHRNVTNLPESIAKEREQRARVRSYVSGKTHADAIEILKKIL
jgi:hypothetical protein